LNARLKNIVLNDWLWGTVKLGEDRSFNAEPRCLVLSQEQRPGISPERPPGKTAFPVDRSND
jgi:hypothetical protein